MVDPVCAAEDFGLLQDSRLLLDEELSDALTCEKGDPWPAPDENVSGSRGADALDGLGGEDPDRGEVMVVVVVVSGGMNVEVSVLTGEQVEGVICGAGRGVEGESSYGAVNVGALQCIWRGVVEGHVCLVCKGEFGARVVGGENRRVKIRKADDSGNSLQPCWKSSLSTPNRHLQIISLTFRACT